MKVTSGSSSAYSTKLISRTFQVHDVHSHWNYVYDFKALTLRGLNCTSVDQWKGHLWKSQIEMRIKKFSLWNAIRLHNSWNIGTEFTVNSCVRIHRHTWMFISSSSYRSVSRLSVDISDTQTYWCVTQNVSLVVVRNAVIVYSTLMWSVPLCYTRQEGSTCTPSMILLLMLVLISGINEATFFKQSWSYSGHLVS
jgi:hypothetical protein